MDKKIGKLFLIGILFSYSLFCLADKNITIDLLDKNYQPLDEAEAGIPFILQITCQNFKPKFEPEGIENRENISVQFAGSTQVMNYVNGASLKQECVFKYFITIKNKGTFNLGPVIAEDSDGTIIRSEQIKVVVGDIGQVQYTGREPYILDMESSSDTVYIGQKLKIELNFCYRIGFENLALEHTSFDDVVIGHQDRNWKTSKKTIEGKEYSCKKMGIEVFPKKVGSLIIPSFKVTFISQQSQDIGLFGFFGFANSKIIESHPKHVQVMPLPYSQIYKDVQAIGKFQSVVFTIDKKEAQIGEGIHAQMIIQGGGNLDIVHHPEIILPDGIRFYEGNSSIERVDDRISKKTFEWIFQSDTAGDFVIEAQSFVYFDPIEKQYKKLSTQSVDLVIQNNVISEQDVQSEIQADNLLQEKEEEIKASVESNKSNQPKIKYYSSQKFYTNKSHDLLTNLIILLAILIVILFVALLLVPYFKKIFFIETLQYRWLFWRYSKSGNIQGIYQLFEKMAYQYKFGLQSQELHQEFLKHKLSNQSFENWKNFLHMLLEFNFASNKSLQDRQIVVHLAKEWFSIILLCCKSLRRT